MQTKSSRFLCSLTWLLVAMLLAGLAPAAAHAQTLGATFTGAGWQASYWNNISLSGAPVLTRIDADVNFNWGLSSPAPEIATDNFAARWTRTLEVTQSGAFRFTLNSDDGARLFIDGQLVINAWYDHGPARTFSATRDLTAGSHEVRIESYERRGAAVVRFGWTPVGGAPVPPTTPPVPTPPVPTPPVPTPPPPTPLPPPASDIWTAEYFNNPDLTGAPVLVRGEGGAISYNWGTGSPAPGVVNNDFFSARWNRTVNLGAGLYRFRVFVDDGARLYVNNQLLINQWRQQSPTEFSAEINLAGGAIPVRLEYVEYTGNAQVRLTWEVIGGSGGGGATPAPEWSHVKPAHAYTGEYFANRDLSGGPALVRQDSDIDFDWGNGAPGPGVPADNFSVRWTNTLRLDKGKYRFTVETDDGVRLFINDRLVIDQWRVQARTKHTYETTLDGGELRIRMEYFDEWGAAFARLRIEVRQEASGAIGNIITCVPPQPQNYAWIKLYRLNSANQWVAISRGIGSINPTGFLKIDGLPVDVNRFGSAGEPYKVEQWVDNRVVQSTGDYLRGEPEFRVRAFADNYTPWRCAP